MDEPEGLLSATAAGARFVWADPVLRAVAVSMCLLLAFLAVDNVALVFLVRETLGGSAAAYGVIEAVFGLGMLAGSFWVLRWAGSPLATDPPLPAQPAASARSARRAAGSPPACPRWGRSRRSAAPATGSR